jgi:hypothetical protein
LVPTLLVRPKLVAWDAASHPLEFVWELADYDQLWDHPDLAVRYNFRSLVDSYSAKEEEEKDADAQGTAGL